MVDKPSPASVPTGRTVLRRWALALPPLLWCLGFLVSLGCGCGCGVSRAVPKATAYTISGSAGLLVYVLVRRSAHWSARVDVVGLQVPMGLNVPLLNPTRTVWAFPDLLANGLTRTAVVMALFGLVGRLIDKKSHSSDARRHETPEERPPVPGVG